MQIADQAQGAFPGLIQTGFRDPGEHAPHGSPTDHAGGLFLIVQIDIVGDLQPCDLGIFLDVNGAEGLGVGETGAEQQLHKHRVVRGDIIQFLARER